jgi:chromosome segregation ATPase
MMPDTTTIAQYLGGIAVFITAIGALVTSFRTNRRIAQSAEAKKREAAEAAQIIVDAASDQVDVIRREAERVHNKLRDEQIESDKWKNHCMMLDDKMRVLTTRVEGAESCQTVMTEKIKVLEYEKKSLSEQLARLTEEVALLREENKRLKEERNNEKEIVS